MPPTRITIKKDTRQDQMEPENKGGDIVAPQIPLPYPARKTVPGEKTPTTPQTGDERTPSRDPPLNLTESCGHPQPPSWDLYYSHTITLYIYLLQSRR